MEGDGRDTHARQRATLAAQPHTALERAIIRRLSELHPEESLAAATADCDASFFAPTGFFLGDRVLDSLDIVEMVVALEVDFGIRIVEAHDVTTYDSIAKLCLLITDVAGEDERAAFERRWGAPDRVESRVAGGERVDKT